MLLEYSKKYIHRKSIYPRTTSTKSSNPVQCNTVYSNHQPRTLPRSSYVTFNDYITPLNLDFLMGKIKLIIYHRIVVSIKYDPLMYMVKCCDFVIVIRFSIQNFRMPAKLLNKLIIFYIICYSLTIKIIAQTVNESFTFNYD